LGVIPTEVRCPPVLGSVGDAAPAAGRAVSRTADISLVHTVPAKPAVQHVWFSSTGVRGQGKDPQSGPLVCQHLISISDGADGNFFFFYTVFHLSG